MIRMRGNSVYLCSQLHIANIHRVSLCNTNYIYQQQCGRTLASFANIYTVQRRMLTYKITIISFNTTIYIPAICLIHFLQGHYSSRYDNASAVWVVLCAILMFFMVSHSL